MREGEIGKRLFGTNGVRGVVGQDMNPELVLRIGAALLLYKQIKEISKFPARRA